MNILEEVDNKEFFKNKNILITGGSGTLGNQLIDFFLETNSGKICVFSRDEFKQHQMKLKYQNHPEYSRLRFFIGDIRDYERIKYALNDINIVFHAASLKQVDTIEYNPMEAVKTNVLGTQNVVNACIENNVDQLIGISTDKCVAPVNLYGATKLCLEKLVIAGYEYSGKKLRTCVLRYGNVIGSRGSVVPIFKKQKDEGEFTVTHEDMTRFTLTKTQACNFILNCVIISKGGEIFVPKLPKYLVTQLCNVLNPNNNIKITGMKPGEKLHEEMISESESLNAWETNNFYIIIPNLSKELIDRYNFIRSTKIFNYSSKDAEIISDEGLLDQISSV